MSDMFLGSQAPLYQNVCIRRRNKNGKILEERCAKNRITRLMLYGIGKFLLGHFNDSSPDKMNEYIPRYLALGTNSASEDSINSGITTISSVNDTRLLNEITQVSTNGEIKNIKRIWIAERNMCKINTKFSDSFIKVSIQAYISSNNYDGVSIGEAGLFSKEKNNNCLARVCFSPIIKNPNEVLDVQWDITLLSYGETKYPDKLEIENGSKISIPLKYTDLHFKEFNIGLKWYWTSNSLGTDYITDLFTYDMSENKFTTIYDENQIKNESGWFEHLKQFGIESYINDFVELILDSKLNDSSNDGQNAKFLISKTYRIPTMFYFGNLYYNPNIDSINTNSLACMMLYNENKEYSFEETKAKYYPLLEEGSYSISTPIGDTNVYKVVKNRIYKNNTESKKNNWKETNYFMYNGMIIDIDRNVTEYSYSNGNFYKTSVNIKDLFKNQFLNFYYNEDNSITINNNMFALYNLKDLEISYSNTKIDLNNDGKIYDNDKYNEYHVSNDGYLVTGEYIKLIPSLTPTNCTDRNVNWKIQNSNIATINFNGVVTAWNLGETTSIGSTSNDLKAKCIVDVVKDSSYIEVEDITLNPSTVTVVVDSAFNKNVIISADVYPLFATNTTLNWSLSHELADCLSIINLGNNKVKLELNGSGNIGAGYVIATSQSGLSKKCLVKVIYMQDEDSECEDLTHLQQEI